jgi:hypothetical protein
MKTVPTITLMYWEGDVSYVVTLKGWLAVVRYAAPKAPALRRGHRRRTAKPVVQVNNVLHMDETA